MPKDRNEPKQPVVKKQSGPAQKVKQGKAELSDKELSKVSGGANKSNDFHF